MTAPFSERLNRILRDGNLTIADLARWFDRPHPTVSGWIRGGEVGGAQLDAAWIDAQLVKLETMLRKKRGLPVPRLGRSERRAHLDHLKSNSHG